MSNSSLELKIEKFYNKNSLEEMKIEPVIINEINAYPMTFFMNQGEIFKIEFQYESKNSKLRKSSFDACKLKITESVVNSLNVSFICIY